MAGDWLEYGDPQNAAQMTIPDIVKMATGLQRQALKILCHIIVLAFTPDTRAVQLLHSIACV